MPSETIETDDVAFKVKMAQLYLQDFALDFEEGSIMRDAIDAAWLKVDDIAVALGLEDGE